MKKVVVGVFCFIVSFGFSQTMGNFDVGSRYINDLGGRIGGRTDKSVQGSQYYDGVESFLPVKIDGYDNETPAFRYNAYRDEMEFQKEGQIYYALKKEGLRINFVRANKVYEVLNYTDKTDIITGYLVVINEGDKVSLYVKEQIKYIAERESATGYDSSKPAEYKKVDDTFFIRIEDATVNFPKNKKELLKMFPDKNPQISDYLKKNKISFSKESDLIELTKFLNTL